MKRALLLLLVLLGLGLLALRRWTNAPFAPAVPGLSAPAAASEPTAGVHRLEHEAAAVTAARELLPVEITAHATPERERPQVYGWLRSAETGRPILRARIVVLFEDWSRSGLSAEEAHANTHPGEHDGHLDSAQSEVQSDGGWYVDLPAKCWVREVLAESNEGAPLRVGKHGNPEITSFVGRSVPVDRALESGALEVSFGVERGIVVEGFVSEEDGFTPVEGAWVVLLGLEGATPAACSGRDGLFRMQGIAPARIRAGTTELEFAVVRERFEDASVRVGWLPGQVAIGPLEARLRRKSP